MALETLKDIDKINNFKIKRINQDMGIPLFHYFTNIDSIVIDNELNVIAFKIQNGPIKETGINGCQVDTLIETAKIIIEELNKNFSCRENTEAINYLDKALVWLLHRRIDRANRGVEGFNKE